MIPARPNTANNTPVSPYTATSIVPAHPANSMHECPYTAFSMVLAHPNTVASMPVSPYTATSIVPAPQKMAASMPECPYTAFSMVLAHPMNVNDTLQFNFQCELILVSRIRRITLQTMCRVSLTFTCWQPYLGALERYWWLYINILHPCG